MYPTKLRKIINLFDSLPEDERRETLVSYADNAKRQEPRESEKFDLVDVRKDEECTDTVGVYLQVDNEGKAHIRMTLGPEVQTLTRSMTAIAKRCWNRWRISVSGMVTTTMSTTTPTRSIRSRDSSSCSCAGWAGPQ